MTREEFKNTGFSAQTKVIFNDKEYFVISIDFEQDLICICEFPEEEEEEEDITFDWKRCENVELVKQI